jgi:hypothetical protein
MDGANEEVGATRERIGGEAQEVSRGVSRRV